LVECTPWSWIYHYCYRTRRFNEC